MRRDGRRQANFFDFSFLKTQVIEKKGKTIPGKKSYSLSVPQYETLRDAISKGLIDQEVEKMKS